MSPDSSTGQSHGELFLFLYAFSKIRCGVHKETNLQHLKKTKNTLAHTLQINVATARPTCFRVNKLHSANTVHLFVLSVSQNKFCPPKVQLFTPTVVCLKYHYILLESPKHLRPLWEKHSYNRCMWHTYPHQLQLVNTHKNTGLHLTFKMHKVVYNFEVKFLI